MEFGVTKELAAALLTSIPADARGNDPKSLRDSLASKLEELKSVLNRSAAMHEANKAWDEDLIIFDRAIQEGRFHEADLAIINLERRELENRTIPQIQKQMRLRMMRGDTALLSGSIREAHALFSQAAEMLAVLSIDEAIACRREGYERLHWHGRKFDCAALNAAQSLIEDNLRYLGGVDKLPHPEPD